MEDFTKTPFQSYEDYLHTSVYQVKSDQAHYSRLRNDGVDITGLVQQYILTESSKIIVLGGRPEDATFDEDFPNGEPTDVLVREAAEHLYGFSAMVDAIASKYSLTDLYDFKIFNARCRNDVRFKQLCKLQYDYYMNEMAFWQCVIDHKLFIAMPILK